jgi:DNA-binding response OmpR family regulator
MKPRILVVDDEWSMRELLQHLLTLSGFEVILACDEDEFRKVLSTEKPDAIILDIILGDTDGTELYKQLLKDGILANNIPVVFLSALASDRPPTLPRPDRRYALIGKPFDPDLLVRELRHALLAYEHQ